VHGKGRIWKISAKEASNVKAATAVLALSEQDMRRADLIAKWRKYGFGRDVLAEALEAFEDTDPFIRAAATDELARQARAENERLPRPDDENSADLQPPPGESYFGYIPQPQILAHWIMCHRRLGKQGTPMPGGAFRELVGHADPSVVKVGLIFAAERRAVSVIPDIEAAMKRHSTDREIFRIGIAALELIDKDASAKPSGSLDGLLLKFMTDAAQPAAIRGLAMLSLQNREGAARTLLELLKDKDSAVAAAAARTLGSAGQASVIAPLRELALNKEAPMPTRLDALGALSGKADSELLPLLPLLEERNPGIIRQAIRTLRGALGNAEVRAALERFAALCGGRQTGPFSVIAAAANPPLALALGKPSAEIRPATDEQWHEALRTGKGDPDEGRRVFFSAAANCATCHTAEGRGVKVGPDLSTIARSSDRAKLADSILQPSREIGPLYVMKTATLKDGTSVTGVQSDKESGGRVDLIQPGGKVEQIPHSKVSKLDISPVSLMTEAIELQLTVQEFRDLIAYMETLR